MVDSCLIRTSIPSEDSIGMDIKTSDSHFSNIIIINYHVGIYDEYGENFYDKIHAWIANTAIVKNSIYFRANGSAYISQCFNDTYETAIYINGKQNVVVSEFRNFYNSNYINSDIIDDTPVLFHISDGQENQNLVCYGYGGYGNNGREATATQADIQRGFDTQAVISKLDGISNGLCDGFYAVNNGMQTGFNGIQMNMMQGNFGLQQAINANNIAAMQNANALQTQLADCCCQNKQGQAQIMYNMATDTCAITTAINNQTQAIMQNDNNNYRALHDEMVANRMADKDEIIAQLRTQLNQCTLATSQQAQNQYLISQLRPSAVPAYLVDNPFRSTGNLPCQQPTCCNG